MSKYNIPKTIRTKDKFVIATTIQFLVEEGYVFSLDEKGHLILKNEQGEIDETFKTEKAFQEWCDDVSRDY